MTTAPETRFASFFQAGFECSSHRRRDGVRLDLLRATGHDRHVLADYRLCRELGFHTIRDGLRWHRIEVAPGRYDWSTWIPALEAAEATGLEVIWDLFHYGSPDHVDQAGPDFAARFTDFALAALDMRESVTKRPPTVIPVNEISFLSWAVEVGYFPAVGPDERGWFKRQLVKAAITAAAAIRGRWPNATFVWAEPAIHIAPKHRGRKEVEAAAQRSAGQFEAYDWLTGRALPELGGRDDLVDIVGVNFYPHNQWYLDGPTIPMGHHEYRPLSDILVEIADRYRKPLAISETGAERSARAPWLHYVCAEVREAQRRGADMAGVCLYPVTAYPGWDNSRHCEVGLLSNPGPDGSREVYRPLYEELLRQRPLFDHSS